MVICEKCGEKYPQLDTKWCDRCIKTSKYQYVQYSRVMWYTSHVRNEQKMLGIIVGDKDIDKSYGKFGDLEYLNLPDIIKDVIKQMTGYHDINISKCGPPYSSQGPGRFYTTEPCATMFLDDLKTTCESTYSSFFDRN